MTYKEYYQRADFNEVWKTLRDTYQEPEETRPLYQAVYQAVCEMTIDKSHSSEKIEVHLFSNGDVLVKGAPDPQEWLVGREVNFDSEGAVVAVNEMVGHLLYWSTLYGIKTQKMQHEDFIKWLDYSIRGPFYTLPDNDLDKIGERFMVKYIFLDFDGVLNTEQYQAQLAIEGKPTKDEYGSVFDPKVVARLSEIVEATKAEINVISSWGEVLGKDKIIEMWEKRGMPGEVRTVFIPDEKCNSKAQWIEGCLDRKIFLPYVILDDESVFLPEQEKYFIKINSVTGISKENTECAIDILNNLENLPPSAFDDMSYEAERERVAHINHESCDRKKLRYWKSTILNDEAYDWSWNLVILRKKLEYNIGYYRFTHRYDGWEKDVDHMALACKLITIALGEDNGHLKSYVNTNNSSRFPYELSDLDKENEDLYNLRKHDLRKMKAYKTLWKLLSRYMNSWWD